MKIVFLRLSAPGTKQCRVAAPLERINEIIDEYRLLGWKVSW